MANEALLDRMLDEIEQLVRVESERRMVVVTVDPDDDEATVEAKRVAAVERLGVHPASVDLTVYVKMQGAMNDDERSAKR